MSETPLLRRIRSFVKREVRITDSQIRAIEENWERYGVEIPPNPPLKRGEKGLVVEIGFGNGESLFNQAKTQPQFNFLGIEVHRPGVGVLLGKLAKDPLDNIRVSKDDALDVIAALPEKSVHGFQIFFPDPWQKHRHQKRRLIQASFLDLIIPKLETGGFIHCATDWEDYARQMLKVLSADPRLENTSPTGTTIERPPHRILSKFEKKGLEKGHGVWDYYFIKPAHPRV